MGFDNNDIEDIKKLSDEDLDDLCDLDNSKVCDNCEKCIDFQEKDYMEIKIEGVIKKDSDLYEEYEDFEVFVRENEKEEELEYDFIEDHEEVREEQYKGIERILRGED